MSTLLAITSAAGFYLIPVILGSGATYLFSYRKKETETDLSKFLISWFKNFVYGSLIIYAIALIADYTVNNGYLNSTFIHTFDSIIRGFLTVAVVTNFAFILFRTLTKKVLKLHKHDLLMIVLIVVSSIASYGIWKWHTPINTTLNWDIYHHQTVATLIGENRFDFATSAISDSFQFDGYSSLFHVLLHVTQSIIPTDILSFWWFVEFFHLLTVVAAAYLIAYEFTQNKWVSLVSVVLGAFVMESAVAYTNYFLIPQNLAAVITAAFIAAEIHKYRTIEVKDKRQIDMAFIAYAIYVSLNHLIIGFVGVFLVAFAKMYLDIFKGIKEKKAVLENSLVLASFSLLVIIPVVSGMFDFSFLNRGEAAHFNFSLAQKYGYALDFYGYLILLVPVGYYFAFRKKATLSKLLIILSNGVLALIVASIPYSMKFYAIERFTLHVIMAWGFWFLIARLNRLFKVINLLAFAGATILILVVNISDYKQVPAYKEIYTHITPDEIEAAKFLKNNYKNQNVLLVSDPATMHLLEGISGINSPGGAYTSTENRIILSNIYYSRDSRVMTENLFNIRDSLKKDEPELIILAISKRFMSWQLGSEENKEGIYWNIWNPQDFSLKERASEDFQDFLANSMNYQIVYKNSNITLFEVRRP